MVNLNNEHWLTVCTELYNAAALTLYFTLGLIYAVWGFSVSLFFSLKHMLTI